MSPTQRSLAMLRKRGDLCAVVEKWNPHAKVRQDFLGFADILSLDESPGVLAVQTTTVSNQAARIQKIKDMATVIRWLRHGNRLEVHGWSKRGPRGQRPTWHCTVTRVP